MALGFSGLQALSSCAPSDWLASQFIIDPFGRDPDGVSNLPEGFFYQIISSFGDTMDDGFLVSHHRSPWGDLIVCEDTDENQDLKGITPNGKSIIWVEMRD